MSANRDFASAAAEAFVTRTLEQVRAVLDPHSRAVVDFACEMQARLERVEALLTEVADVDVLGPDLLQRIDTLLNESKRRTP